MSVTEQTRPTSDAIRHARMLIGDAWVDTTSVTVNLDTPRGGA
jgi:hypothetical protein